MQDIAHRPITWDEIDAAFPVICSSPKSLNGDAPYRDRILKYAHCYLSGFPPLIASASLRGPFPKGWSNPWRINRRPSTSIPRTLKTVRTSSRHSSPRRLNIDSIPQEGPLRVGVVFANHREFIRQPENIPIKTSAGNARPISDYGHDVEFAGEEEIAAPIPDSEIHKEKGNAEDMTEKRKGMLINHSIRRRRRNRKQRMRSHGANLGVKEAAEDHKMPSPPSKTAVQQQHFCGLPTPEYQDEEDMQRRSPNPEYHSLGRTPLDQPLRKFMNTASHVSQSSFSIAPSGTISEVYSACLAAADSQLQPECDLDELLAILESCTTPPR